mmetsp:Transcript_45528/g.75632  ORF Transcript_45528/g.75632 Transcript_45528/m.75632 type:complete len:132 (+) Transcript_45528:131-526(+)
MIQVQYAGRQDVFITFAIPMPGPVACVSVNSLMPHVVAVQAQFQEADGPHCRFPNKAIPLAPQALYRVGTTSFKRARLEVVDSRIGIAVVHSLEKVRSDSVWMGEVTRRPEQFIRKKHLRDTVVQRVEKMW